MNIVITGAARGIGKAIATAFANQNNTLLICARNEDTLATTAKDMQAAHPNCTIKWMVADLSKVQEVVHFADWCLSFGAPNILVNNAGGFVPGNILSEADGNLENMINNNLYSAYNLTRKLAPAMVKAGTGYIFNICSIASLHAYDGGGSYSISKYALNGFSQNLRHELKASAIKVTTVYPGAVYTDSWQGFDNSEHRIMEASDIAKMIEACTQLSLAAVPEQIIIRPQLGDL